jgi:hypothetical protein
MNHKFIIMQTFTILKKRISLWMLFGIAAVFSAYSQKPTWELVTPKYETAEAFVAGFNVLDYGADPTGEIDQTKLFQDLLDKLGSRSINKGTQEDGTPNGGILYIPEGKYLFEGSLFIPKGVTILGDWEKPVKGQPIKGTILMPTRGKGRDVYTLLSYEAFSFITMQPSTAVRNVNIWYPDQEAGNIVAYPPAILFGQQGYWGNDYNLVTNVTLVNAFDGVIYSRRSGGGAPNCYGIYGTPLRRGIEIDNIAEVGRVDNVDFSPAYWAGSGLPGAPAVNGPHKDFIAQNGTGITLRRIDWSFVGKAKIEGYNVGQRLDYSYNDDTNGNKSSPNGHNYAMEFTNCKYGVYVSAVAGAGCMFYDYKFNNCDWGFYFEGDPKGTLQVQGSEFDTNKAAIYTPTTNSTRVLVNQCTFNRGPIDFRGGLSSVIGSTFNAEEGNQIQLGMNARSIITGNTFKDNDPKIKNVSMYECVIDHTPVVMSELPAFPYKNQYDFKQKPTGTAYRLATAGGVSVTADDNSAALQVLLDEVAAAGGGIVYLPPGHYNFKQPITIPSGVELKGSVDTPSLPTGPGSAMEIYAGKGDENGTPFITMAQGSGIRGLIMNYPEQMVQLLTQPALNGGDVYHYPYCIRGNKDVYIVNIAMRAVYNGVDFFTNKCDNHYMDYLAGHVFHQGVRVGGGSKGGHIYNCQFNQIAYGSGGETKFGQWPNSPNNNRTENPDYDYEHDMAYAYCWNHMYFMILEDCEDQILFNNFAFGSNRCIYLRKAANGKGPSGISLGQGVDAGMNAFYIAGVDNDKGFPFINSQIVTTVPTLVNQTYIDNNRYIEVAPEFDGKITFFAADFWGNPQNISNNIQNGTIELQAGNFSNSGRTAWGSVGENGSFDVLATHINPIGTLMRSGSNLDQTFIQSSFVNKGNLDLTKFGLWHNNLDQSASVSETAGAFVDRTGWIATASIRNDDAMLTLDGDKSTRWSTMSDNQKPGYWFQVDMLEARTITGIYMDAGSNTYLPSAFTVSVSVDGEEWTTVGTGRGTATLNFGAGKTLARYIKVTLTGSSSSAWRITEFLVMDSYLIPTSIAKVASEKEVNVWFEGNQLKMQGISGLSTLKLYAVSGQQVMAPVAFENAVSVNIPSGIYIATIENKGTIFRKKLIKQ